MNNNEPPQAAYPFDGKEIRGAAPEPKLKEVLLKDSQGSLLKVSQEGAAKACTEHGMHLPTIRELAKLGQLRGAKGVLEASEVRDQNLTAGFALVTATSPDEKKDDFFYNPVGYVPTRESKGQIFWSSSYCVGCVIPTGANSSHVFDGNDGRIHDHYDSLDFAVRCVSIQ
jgi:hypothetical protein